MGGGGGRQNQKFLDSIFFMFSTNLNSINLKVFPINGGINKFERKFNKHSGERHKALRNS